MPNSYETTRKIKLLITKAKNLDKNINRTLNDSATESHARYVLFKTYAEVYNSLLRQAEDILGWPKGSTHSFLTNKMKAPGDTLWSTQKSIVEAVALYNSMLLANLENAVDFAEDEFDNLANFIKSKLRSTIFSQPHPSKEIDIQNAIEILLIGRNLSKGIDYDRESGKFEFSGKEYIPDFILPKMNLCIEVKLLRPGKKSAIIDEINADITAYSAKYERLLFVVYDLGVIRDEAEFRRDIENAGASIKVVIIKH